MGNPPRSGLLPRSKPVLGKDEKRSVAKVTTVCLNVLSKGRLIAAWARFTRMSASRRSGLIASIGRLYQHDRQYRESFLSVC
jgi:hypothetical protein